MGTRNCRPAEKGVGCVSTLLGGRMGFMGIRRCLAVMAMVGMAVCGYGQNPLKTLPKNYWVEFENPWVRVVQVHYGAGERVAQHDHPKTPTLYVYLSDAGPVRFVHGGEDDFSLTRKPVKTGQLRLSPGREETHSVVSLSKTASDFLRVELKTLPLGFASLHGRVAAAEEDFWRRPERVEFEDAHLRVTRVGVAPEKSVVLEGGGRTVWLVVRGEEALGAGKAMHAGQALDSGRFEVRAGGKRVALFEVELK
jgi:hypothetical protein